MGAANASAWLLPAWRRSLEAIGATADEAEIEALGRRLIERWSDQHRKHHNLRRLVSVLARVDELASETHSPDLVRVAAWYHGAVFRMDQTHVYTRRGGIDEAASADLARSELAGLGVPPERIERVAELIHTLARHHVPDGDLDAMALCDANLGGLAAEPQKYATYRREVREEYSNVPDLDYYRARLAIIDKLLARPKLFTSPLGQAWEERARENLGAERARVSAELAKLPGGTVTPARGGGRRSESTSFFARDGAAPARPTDSAEPAGAFVPLPPARPQERPRPATPAAGDSPADTGEDARPLVKDYPKGRTLRPKVRRIAADARARTRELRLIGREDRERPERSALELGELRRARPAGPEAPARPAGGTSAASRDSAASTGSVASAPGPDRAGEQAEADGRGSAVEPPEDGSTMTRPPTH